MGRRPTTVPSPAPETAGRAAEVAARPANTRGARSGSASGWGRTLPRLALRDAEEMTLESSFSSGGRMVRVGRGMSGEGRRTALPGLETADLLDAADTSPASSRGRGRGATCEPASLAGAGAARDTSRAGGGPMREPSREGAGPIREPS